MKKVFLYIIVLFLTACASEEKHEAASIVAKMWNAQKCIVSTSRSADTGDENEIILTIENIKSADEDYPKKYITSISAFKFLENLPVKEVEGFTKIKIVVKKGKQTFDKTYPISELITANDLLINTDLIIQKIKNGDLNNFENNFDKTEMPDSVVMRIKNTISDTESKYGKPEKAIIVGFEFASLRETKQAVLMVYCEISNPRAFNTYKFILRRSDKKIVHLGINEII
jgi:hypothetical protein